MTPTMKYLMIFIVGFIFISLTSCTPVTTEQIPESTVTPILTKTSEPIATAAINSCDVYFESINPSLIVNSQDNKDYDPTKGLRSILLRKNDTCPMIVLKNKGIHLFINELEIIPDVPFIDELIENEGYLRLDYDIYDIPDTYNLKIEIQDQNGNNYFVAEVLNIAKTGIFRIPGFTNVQSGITTPQIIESRELRVYHVDSIPVPLGEVTSSFNIGDIKDVGDQCDKPDGIHPGFLHPNAIDYRRCEVGIGSTSYEIHYLGPYPITVKKIEEGKNGLSVYFE